MLSLDDLIARTASTQEGVFSRRQARDAGFSDGRIRSRLDSGRWLVVAPKVYSFEGHGKRWRRLAWIADLWAGPHSVMSHQSAAALHGVSDALPGLATVSVPHAQRRSLPGVHVHRVDDLRPTHLTRVCGLPVTTTARTAVDLAGAYGMARLERVIENMVFSKSVRLEEVGAVLSEVRRKGKPGVRRTEQVLDAMTPGAGLSRSHLENLLDRCLKLTNLPEPIREHPLPSSTEMIGFVDRAYPEARLIIEADGRRWHSRRQDMHRDRERDMEAASVGWQTIRPLWEHLTSDPAGMARLIERTYRLRLGDLSRAVGEARDVS